MSRSRLRPAVAVLALFAGLAVPASAATVTYTYTGSVQYGYDDAGIFGMGQALTGAAYSLVETFDLGNRTFGYADGIQSFQFGGLLNGTPDSARAVVTIGSTSRAISDMSDYIFSASSSGKHLDFVKDDAGFEYTGFYFISDRTPGDYTQPFTLSGSQGTFYGNYQFYDAQDASRKTFANFDVARLTVTSSVMSAVPLPSAMPMFGAAILAFGAVGYAFKRRYPNPRRDDTSTAS